MTQDLETLDFISRFAPDCRFASLRAERSNPVKMLWVWIASSCLLAMTRSDDKDSPVSRVPKSRVKTE